MYFTVVEPVFYIYSIFPRKVCFFWDLAVSRLAAGKMIYSNQIVFRLNQLGNSSNIFTPGDVQNTNVAYQHSQQTRDDDPMLVQFWPIDCDAGPA